MLRSVCKIYPLVYTNICSVIPKFTNGIGKINTLSYRYLCSQPSHIVQMRGLDAETKEKDVVEFFKSLSITPKAVHLKFDGSGRVAGASEVEFATHAEAVVAMRKKNAFMGNRFVRLTLKSSDLNTDQFKKSDVTKGGQQQPIAKDFNIATNIDGSYHPTGNIVRMKNVPRRMNDLAIYEFFWPVGVAPISVKAFYNESGIRTGEFEVQFLTKNDAVRAMAKNNAYLGKKFVELSLKQR